MFDKKSRGRFCAEKEARNGKHFTVHVFQWSSLFKNFSEVSRYFPLRLHITSQKRKIQGRSQEVRHGTLTPASAGSSPAAPANLVFLQLWEGRAVKRGPIIYRTFFCPGCESHIVIPKRLCRATSKGHIKTMYCPFCKDIRDFVQTETCTVRY